MRDLQSHISDQDLLRAADGELSGRKIVEIRKHLTECRLCRSRSVELKVAITDFAGTCRQVLDSQLPPPDRPRALLKLRMKEMSAVSSSRPWWRLFTGMIYPDLIERGWRRIAVAAAILIMAAHFFQPWSDIGTATAQARAIPDRRLTPGATIPVTKEELCTTGNPHAVVRVSEPIARQVFAAYGIRHPQPRAYELDYLITPALGGEGSLRNFWPQPYRSTTWNAHLKDALEDHLHTLVCDGNLDLATAQRDIAEDWIEAYRKYFRTSRPLAEHAAYEKDEPWE